MITIGGALTSIGLIGYIIKNRKSNKLGIDLFMITILASLVFEIGHFAKINNTVIEYNYMFSIISFLGLIITYIQKKDINKRDIGIIVGFLIYIAFSIAYPILFNQQYIGVSFGDSWDLYFSNKQDLGEVSFSKHSLGMFARVIMFIIQFYIFAKNVDKEDMVRYSKIFYKVSWGILIFAFLEFLITNIIDVGIFRKILFFILGKTDSTYFIPRIGIGGIYMPMGLMREPSNYVKSLFIFALNNLFVLYSCIDKKQKRGISLSIVMLMVIMFFSNALSGYIYIMAIMFAVIYMLKNKKIKIGISVVLPVLALIFILIAKDRLTVLIDSFKVLDMSPKELDARSELIRLYSINNNLSLFLKQPILGCGFGTVYCYSAIVTLITNVGLVGIGLYTYIMYYINSIATKSKKFSYLTLIVLFITNCFIGHMSQIIYIETFAFQIVILKMIELSKKEKMG